MKHIGIPKDSVARYEAALKADKSLVLAHGVADEVTKARDILQRAHPMEIAVHAAEHKPLALASGQIDSLAGKRSSSVLP